MLFPNNKLGKTVIRKLPSVWGKIFPKQSSPSILILRQLSKKNKQTSSPSHKGKPLLACKLSLSPNPNELPRISIRESLSGRGIQKSVRKRENLEEESRESLRSRLEIEFKRERKKNVARPSSVELAARVSRPCLVVVVVQASHRASVVCLFFFPLVTKFRG